MTNKTNSFHCPICGRRYDPTKANALYNIPEVGLVCVDCMDRTKRYVQRHDYETDLSYTLRAIKEYKNLYVYGKRNFKISYMKRDFSPFKILVSQGKNGTEVSLNTIDDLISLRNELDKFISKCVI